MSIKINDILSSVRWSIGYIVLTPIIVSIFVVWNATQRTDEFERAHYRIAESTTTIVASEISKRIKNQQRLLSIFAKNEEDLIHRLASSPLNETLKLQLYKKIEESFPDFFVVSLANNAGIPIIDDFDGRVGGRCLEDLKKQAEGNTQPIRIHPNSQEYHIDIVVPWGNNEDEKHVQLKGKKSGLLFVSFKPDFLFQLLALSSTPQHELMLLNKDVKNLIEITEKGARVLLKRDDFRLTEEEKKRRLYSTPVQNSAWNLVDFRNKTLFSDYRQNIINYSLVILVLFIIASVLMVAILLRSEKSRINAAKTKEEMFSLFNHDLRAPLTSIFGFLEIYTETTFCEKNPEKCKPLGKRAFDNSLMMLAIVDDILDIQKMESGEMLLDFTNVDIVSLVRDAVEMSIQYGLSHNIKLEVLAKEEVIQVRVDDRRMKQVITNLLSNAIKYSPEHDIVTVSVVKIDTGVMISVSDNGPGIEEDFQKLVFDKFSQSKLKLTQNIGGTGLGLAIVKYIVDLHKGTVKFKTSADKGTTFNIVLPN